jgi:hypothetical protein
MESHNRPTLHAEHATHHAPAHKSTVKPIDAEYRVVVRTVLWIIAGLVFLGFVLWWALT